MNAMETVNNQWLQLRDQLAANAGDLLRQGSFVRRAVAGRRSWVLRFRVHERGRTRQRAIRVDGDSLKVQAEEWLKQFRRILVWQREIEANTRIAAWISLQIAPQTLAHNWGPRRKRRHTAQ